MDELVDFVPNMVRKEFSYAPFNEPPNTSTRKRSNTGQISWKKRVLGPFSTLP